LENAEVAHGFIDVNIPMYAAGTSHPLREPSRAVIRAIVSRRLDAVTDAEVLQEILYRYLYIGESQKGFQVFDLFRRIMLGNIFSMDDGDVQRARELAEEYPGLSPRDLIHLSIMIRHDVNYIITADKGFEQVTQVQRIDPAHINEFLK